MEIRAYRGDDEQGLIELWNRTMPQDGIVPSVFRTKVLLDANFAPGGLLVADEAGTAGGVRLDPVPPGAALP